MRLTLVAPFIHLVEASQARTSSLEARKKSVRPIEDSELVARIQNGENDLFSELVRRYQDRIYTQCLRQLGQKEHAAEVAQDIFIKIFQNIQNFRHDSSVSTWVFRIAINHCINQRQKSFRRKQKMHEPLEGNNPDRPREIPGDSNVVNDAQNNQWRIHIDNALEILDPEQREILILRELQDLSYEEISAILNLPIGTVKSRMHRARTALAKILAPYVNPDDLEAP